MTDPMTEIAPQSPTARFHIPLRVRFAALAIVPLLGMVVFASINIGRQADQRAEAEQSETLALLSVRIGDLLHETQKERGATALYLGSGGERFLEELPAQRDTTDGPRTAFLEFFDQHEGDLPDDLIAVLQAPLASVAQLDQQRALAWDLAVTAPESIGFYTAMNSELLDAVAATATYSKDPARKGAIITYATFLNAKERTGIERAQVSSLFARGEPVPGQINAIVALVSAQASYLDLFSDLADDATLATFETAQADPIVAEVARMEAIALETDVNDPAFDGYGEEPEYWFDTITARINLLKGVEDFQADAIISSAQAAAASASSTYNRSLAFALFAGLATLAVAAWTTLDHVRRLRHLADVADSIAKGHLAVEVPEPVGNDDIARLTRGFANMAEATGASVRHLQASSGRLGDTAHDLAMMSGAVTSQAEQAASQAQVANELCANVGESMGRANDAITTMDNSIRQVADRAATANRVADDAVQIAGESTASIEQLGESSNRIGEVIDTINAIAEQTNMLALNATIEAARAGDAGKGFAVVATEVKELASQTANATQEISERVDTIQRDVATAVDANGKIADTIHRINEINASISEAVSDQTSAVDEIRGSIGVAADGTTAIRTTMEEVTAAAADTLQAGSNAQSAASNTTSIADELADLVDAYHLEPTS
ncbi:MAG: methyl-accepting chemotaxis protein [Actinomycetota bacterium]